MLAATACPQDVPNCTGLLDFNATLVVQLVVFVLTATVLWMLIWRPIVEILEEREQRIAAGESAAAEAERRYSDGLSEVQTILERARAEAREILAEAHRTGSAAAEQTRADAHRQAQSLSEQALAEIRAERDVAVASLRAQAEQLAVLAASRLLDQRLDPRRSAQVASRAVSR